MFTCALRAVGVGDLNEISHRVCCNYMERTPTLGGSSHYFVDVAATSIGSVSYFAGEKFKETVILPYGIVYNLIIMREGGLHQREYNGGMDVNAYSSAFEVRGRFPGSNIRYGIALIISNDMTLVNM